jgi:serine/threonine-protein kinase
MATVYRATRLLIGDTVAVKILHPEQLRDPQAPERFRREAQAAARLKHQNAVTIYDFGISDGGIVYLVMELVEGQSLRWLIKEQGPLVPSAASEIMTQVCAALDEAHTQKVVHRDIKPDNIIVATSASGLRVKVLDFGIARLRDMSGFGNLTNRKCDGHSPIHVARAMPRRGVGRAL